MAATYNWPNIRALLIAGFTEDELRQFCFDTPEFKPLYPQLARSSSAADIADQLIEYADQKLKTELLLVWAAEKNLARFEEHQPYQSNVNPALLPSSTGGGEIQQFVAELAQVRAMEQPEGERPLVVPSPTQAVPFPVGRFHSTRFHILLSVTGVVLVGGLGWIMILFVFLPTPPITSPVLTTTVVIASFVNCPDASTKVIQELETNYAELKPSLQIKNLAGVSNSQEARQQGKRSSADLIIWGECVSANQLTMYLEILTARGPDEVVELQSVTAQTSALDLDRANRLSRAVINYLQGNYKDAADNLRILQGEARSEQEQAELAFLQANSLLFAESYEAARTTYTATLTYAPLKTLAYNNRGVASINWAYMLSENNQPYEQILQAAINDLTEATTAVEPHLRSLAYINRSTIYYLFTTEYAQALADCEQAITLASTEPLGYVCQAAVRYQLLKQSPCDQANPTPIREDLVMAETMAKAQQRNLPDVFFWRGYLSLRQGQCNQDPSEKQIYKQEAKDNFQKVLDLVNQQWIKLALDQRLIDISTFYAN
ncbi:MAG: hypothetical protein DPW09_14510 [Anaerolineae bacterium]|nr:hypothetical protein [Anaerolineales bacterium]MCQ3974651.1 hypothetical protein [Anaerolineae bacterium]